MESMLYVITDIMKAARTYIACSSFKHMDTHFDLCTVLLIDSLGHLAHALIECHDFQPLKHCDMELLLATEVLDGCDKVYRLGDVEIDNTYNRR